MDFFEANRRLKKMSEDEPKTVVQQLHDFGIALWTIREQMQSECFSEAELVEITATLDHILKAHGSIRQKTKQLYNFLKDQQKKHGPAKN